MVNPEIVAEPLISFNLDQATVNALIDLALNHYDGVCKAAGRTGGLLCGWSNRIVYSGSDTVKITARFRDVDLTLKICGLLNGFSGDEIISNQARGLINQYCEQAQLALRTINSNTEVIKSWRIAI